MRREYTGRKSPAKAALRELRIYPNLLAFFRDMQNPSQMEIAGQLGIGESYLSMIKWGRRVPGVELALKISELCRVPIESLIRKAS